MLHFSNFKTETEDFSRPPYLESHSVILLCSILLVLCFALSILLGLRSISFSEIFTTIFIAAFPCFLIQAAIWQLSVKLHFTNYMRISIFGLGGLIAAMAFAFLVLPHIPHTQRLDIFLAAFGETVLAALLIYSIATHAQLRHTEKKQLSIKQQNHIRNHFLFNSINTATCLIHFKPEMAKVQLTELADLFRIMLGMHAWVSLKEEIGFARCYVGVERIRLNNKLDVNWQISCDRASEIHLPSMILQPLIENAIYYGVETMPDHSTIKIKIIQRQSCLHLELCNAVSEIETHTGSHSAHANIRSRLYEAFGKNCRFMAQKREGCYTVSITMPVSNFGRRYYECTFSR